MDEPLPKKIDPNLLFLTTLEDVPLPTAVTVIEPITLLNATGKETAIPLDTVIMVEKRSSSGTLTMQINGALHVGNESRILQKVKLRQP